MGRADALVLESRADALVLESRADALVLEIGGDVGALVVYTDSSLAGKELDLVPVGSPRTHDVHNVVRPCTTGSGETIFAAVFPQVREGCYTLFGPGAMGALAKVAITGGHVSEARTGRPERPYASNFPLPTSPL